MLSVAFFLLLYGLITLSTSGSPQGKDRQEIVIKKAEHLQDGQWVAFKLPGFLDVQKEETIRILLDYSFEKNTTPSLIMQANHTFMRFSMNGENIYEIPVQSHSLGNYYTNFTLPQQAKGQYLELSVNSAEKGLKRILIPEIYITDEANFQKNILRQDNLSLVLSFIIILAAVEMFILSFVGRKLPGAKRLALQGMFALNIGIYFLCETPSILYLFPSAKLIYYADMLCFSMIAAPLLLLLSLQLHQNYRRILHGMAGICMLNTLLQLLLGLTGVMEFRLMLQYTHITQIAAIALIFYCFIDSLRRRRKTEAFLAILPAAIGGIVDLLLFFFERNTSYNSYFLKLGFLIYILQQIYQYVRQFAQQAVQKNREIYYKYLAFRDPLTSCQSRVAFEIDKSDWDKSSPRTVFSIDLNDLKRVNDQFGHEEGDRLIKTFGELLNRTFADAGKCYRIGGDEFLAFCDGLVPGQAQELVADLAREVYRCNAAKALPIQISYAIGVCVTRQVGADLQKAIQQADERMYENKRKIKALAEH